MAAGHIEQFSNSHIYQILTNGPLDNGQCMRRGQTTNPSIKHNQTDMDMTPLIVISE